MVCKLEKSIYGLKQASRMWNERFHLFITRQGFQRSSSDYCLYVYLNNAVVCYVLLYVDDLLIISNCSKTIHNVRQLLFGEFEMTDIGKAESFLGIFIERNQKDGIIYLSQSEYLKNVLRKFEMDKCKPAYTPIENSLHLEKDDMNYKCNKPYRELIGCLIYATLTTRPDLCASTNYFSRYQSSFNDIHYDYAKRILRYIKGTIDLKLAYHRNPDADILVGYTDADWANDLIDRKSVSGYIFKVFGNTVSWASRKQSTVSLSSTEAEYVALSQGACEAIWLRNLLRELGITCNEPIKIFEDNQSCIRVAQDPKEHKRMKHIDVRYNFIRDAVSNKVVSIEYVSSGEQTADIMTKGLGRNLFEKHRNNLNLV